MGKRELVYTYCDGKRCNNKCRVVVEMGSDRDRVLADYMLQAGWSEVDGACYCPGCTKKREGDKLDG